MTGRPPVLCTEIQATAATSNKLSTTEIKLTTLHRMSYFIIASVQASTRADKAGGRVARAVPTQTGKDVIRYNSECEGVRWVMMREA